VWDVWSVLRIVRELGIAVNLADEFSGYATKFRD
jgi:hypothetical protein